MIVALTALLLLLAYFGYYLLFLKDQSQTWISSNDIDLDDNSSVELVVTDIKGNEIKYCVVNDCTYALSIPTAKIETNEFDGWGEYKITYNFSKYLLFPWSKYTYLKSWSIEKIEDEESDFTAESYLEGVKKLLENYYVWEIYSLPTLPAFSREEASFINENPILDWDYTKSLYLLYQISQSESDTKLKQAFDKEISYLNDNAETIIEGYEAHSIPPAYLLKLIDQGLSSQYISLVDSATIPQYYEEVLEQTINDKVARPIDSRNPDLTYYDKMIRYADDYSIFAEYDRKDLADFTYNQMLVLFNSIESLNGICTLAYSNHRLIDATELRDKFENVFGDTTTQLIEGNLYELVMCKKYVNTNDCEIEGLEQSIDNVLDVSTSRVGEYFFIMGGTSTSGENIEELPTIKSFNLLDNLIYILSEK